MKILLVSDTHKYIDKLKELNNKYKDYIKIHLGDRGFDKSYLDNNNFIYVNGNCDLETDNKTKIINIENKKILITHGDLYNVKYDLNNLYYKALEENCDYVFYGHTHIQKIDKFNNITFINPGALKNNNYCIIIDDEIILK